jgi:GNAT superfamily N-acetyltransferase
VAGVDLHIASLAERPDLAPLLGTFPGAWPEFMYQDPVGDLYYAVAPQEYPEYVLVAVDPADPSRAAAKAHSVPYTVPDELPGGGWDRVILDAAADRAAGRRGTDVSALEINIQVDLRGTGLAATMLDALRDNARSLGHRTLVAPVRPNGKHAYPTESIHDYAWRTRPDGLPVDPWLRVHVRAGARIVAVAPHSMTIVGTLADWRAWTGLPFDTPGPVIVPAALVPVHCDPAQGHAVYVEPNIWVRHDL